MKSRFAATLLLALAPAFMLPAAQGAESRLTGRWVLNHELSREKQPDDPEQRDLLGNLPRTTVSVGGVPLPVPGTGQLPRAAGSPLDPAILHSVNLAIETDGEQLRLVYDGGHSESLKRGNDQGLVSRWSSRKLTTRYETTSRSVRQVYEVRLDGRLLVTVKLNPRQGPTLVHKRIFDPLEDAETLNPSQPPR